MLKKNHQRRRLIVDRAYQYGTAGRMAGALGANLLLFFGIAYSFPLLLQSERIDRWELMVWISQPQLLFQYVALPLLAVFMSLFVFTVLESFRVAGPAYRIRETFRELTALRIPCGMRIRKKDQLQDTAAAISQGLESLHEHVVHIQSLAREVEDARCQMSEAGGDDARSRELFARWDRCRSAIDELTPVSTAPGCMPLGVESTSEQSAPEPRSMATETEAASESRS